MLQQAGLLVSPVITKTQAAQLEVSKRGLPPFSVRNNLQICGELGQNAVPNGFVTVPIYNVIDPTWVDDLVKGGCAYVSKVESAQIVDDLFWNSSLFTRTELADPFG